MPCHILLERAVKAEKNGILCIEIGSYYDELVTALTLTPISRHSTKTKSVKYS